MKLLILTALAIEQSSLVKKINAPAKEVLHEYFDILLFQIQSRTFGTELSIYTCCFNSVGNVESGIKTANLIHSITPDFIILTGICGGIKNGKSLNLIDILVPEKIIYYEYARVQKGGTMSRYKHIYIEKDLIMSVKKMLDSNEFNVLLNENHGINYNVHFNPILSGEKVVADEEFQKVLVLENQDALGIEMESFGCGTAISLLNKKIHYLVIKSISDWADENKNDDFQVAATDVVSEFVLHFIHCYNFNK